MLEVELSSLNGPCGVFLLCQCFVEQSRLEAWLGGMEDLPDGTTQTCPSATAQL